MTTGTMRTYTLRGDENTQVIYLDLHPDGHLRMSADTVAKLLEFAGFVDTTGERRDPRKA
jgi:hypothetical protein